MPERIPPYESYVRLRFAAAPVLDAGSNGRRKRPVWLSRRGRDVLRRARGHHAPAAFAALRAEVQHPVRGLDHLQVVLDHDHRVALVHQRVQHLQQLADVLEMQPRRRFVQDIQRPAGGAPCEFLAQLDPLRLAAGQRGSLLAQLHVAQAYALQDAQAVPDAWVAR